MEEFEKVLKSHNWTDESTIKVLLNSNNKSSIKEILPTIRKYTNAVVIHYKDDLQTLAQIHIGDRTITLA